MIVCLSCRHATADASVFCPFCARSLNALVCPQGHKNSFGSRCCATCGNLQLSEGTRALRLGWISTALSVGAALLLWKACVTHLAFVFHGLTQGLLWSAAVLTNSSIPNIQYLGSLVLFWIVALWVLGHFLTFLPSCGGAVGTALRSLPVRLAHVTLRALGHLLRFTIRSVRRRFFGT